MDFPIPCNIRIYDDCSSEYDISEIKKIFPTAASIRRNERNFKADMNMFLFYKDFLSTNDEYLFNADSDIIFNKNCISKALDLIKYTDGVLSVFNATSHPPKEIIDENLCIKETIGAAGTFFSRKRIEEIVNYFSSQSSSEKTSFDWKWSKFLVENNIRIFCTNISLVQHIGYYGQNTIIKYKGYKKIATYKPYFDYGRNFIIDTIETGQIINNIFEKFIDQNRIEDERIVKIFSQRPITRFKAFIKKMINYKESE